MVAHPEDMDWHSAWRTLFPGEAPPRAADLVSVVRGRARSAFRNRVRVVHPDQAAHQGRDADAAASEFRGVVAAYERLCAIASPSSPVPRPAPPDSVDLRCAPPSRPTPLPNRPLALAQVLFHLDWVPSGAVFESLRWQRERKLALGVLAVREGCLSEADVRRVLLARVGRERFGECASRLGVLSRAEVRSLLARQRSLQPLVGSYFVTVGLITPAQLREALHLQHLHNQSVAQPLSGVAA